MSVHEIKHAIANYLRKKHLSDTFFYKVILFVNNFLFHRNEKMKRKKYGLKNPEITFYVIRQHSKEEGLLSMYGNILKEVEYALKKGYIPFVDLQNNITQYTTGELINGTSNAWEFFWKQPTKYCIDEIYKSQNVILSGKNRLVDREKCAGRMFQLYEQYDFNDSASTQKLYRFIKKHMDIQPYICDRAEHIWKEKFEGEKVIGVFCRGTDYVAFRPKAHPVQPTREYLYQTLVKLRQKHINTKVFLVTEDDGIYSYFKKNLGNALIEIEDIRFADYKEDDYIAKYCRNNTYQIGLHYLIKLLLLSKCSYLVTSITNGSKYANILNNDRYEERIVVNLGVYK